MERINSFKVVAIIPILIGLLFTGLISVAQTPPPFRYHEVIDAGNGMKVEVLSCRGVGENEECDVIYYTEKRYLGKRKWEKSSVLKELKVAARMAQVNKNKGLAKPPTASKQPEAKAPASKKNPVAKKQDVPVKKNETVIVRKPVERKDSLNTSSNKGNTTTQSTPPIQKEEILLKDNQVIKQEAIKLGPGIFSKPHSYTLANIYGLAKERNLSVKQAQNSVYNFEIDQKIAKGSYLPSASYNIGHYFTRGKNIDPVTNTFSYDNFSGGYTALAVQLDLFSGFSRLNTVKQAGYNVKAAEYAKKKIELELLSNLTLAYARLLLDKEQIAVQKSLMQNTAREIEVINEKIKVGRLSKYEFYAFNARLNTQQANLVTLQNDSSAAVSALKELLNFSQADAMDVVSVDTALLTEIYSTNILANEFIAKILNQHPAIKQIGRASCRERVCT